MEVKKKNYILGALLCILPCATLFIAQLVGSLVPTFKWNNTFVNEVVAEKPNVGVEELVLLVNQKLTGSPEAVAEITLWSMLASAVVFILWYMFTMSNRDLGIRKTLTGKKVGQAVLLGCGVQGVVTLIVSFLNMLLPKEAGDSYSELMDRLADTTNPAIIISLIFLAPIAEELAFRGLTLNYAKEYFGEKKAIVISSLMFGAVHLGNGINLGVLIQVAYAFCIGFVFAKVAVKYKTLWITVLMHMVVNALAAGLSAVQEAMGNSEASGPVIFGILLLLGAVGTIIGGKMFLKTPKEERLTAFEEKIMMTDSMSEIGIEE